MSPASAPAVPCLTDSCLERANYIYIFSQHGWCYCLLWAFALAMVSARSISKQADNNKQTWSTHSSLSVLWDSDHVAQSLSPCSPFLRSPPGCACLLNSLPLGKAVALRLHVRLYTCLPIHEQQALWGQNLPFTPVFWVIPGSRRDWVNS